MYTVNTYEAKTHLSSLLDRAAAGEEILIARAGKPVARLVGYTETKQPRQGGQLRGQIHMSDDFDAPLPPEILGPFLGQHQ